MTDDSWFVINIDNYGEAIRSKCQKLYTDFDQSCSDKALSAEWIKIVKKANFFPLCHGIWQLFINYGSVPFLETDFSRV